MRLKFPFSRKYLIFPGVLVVFFFMFYLIYSDIKVRTIDEFNSEQMILAETAGQGIISLLSDYQCDINFLAGLQEIITPDSSTLSTLARFRNIHQQIIEAVTRVDEKGTILVTYPVNKAVIGRNISYQKHVGEILVTHRTVISDVFRSAQGYDAIAVHVPVFRGKEYKGSLAILISINKLGKLYLGKIKIRGTGSVWLLSANGIELYCQNKDHEGNSFLHNTGYHPSAISLLNTIRSSSQGSARSVHQATIENGKVDFNEKFIVYHRVTLGNTYWTIIISFYDKDIYYSLIKLRNRLILVFGIIFIFTIYFFYSIANVRKVIQAEQKRKKAEEQNQMLANALKSVNECVSITDRQNNLIFVNEAFTKEYGYTLAELTGKNMSIVDSPRNRKEIQEEIRLSTLESGWYGEMYNIRKDGSEFPISLSTTGIKDKHGTLVGLIGVASDITQRKEAEAELIAAKNRAEESDRLKSAFLANISHEIRTPMNGILGFTSLLSDPDLTRGDMLNYIGLIEKSGERLLGLINNIMDVARIESGMVGVVREMTDIPDALDYIIRFFQPEAEFRGLTFLCSNDLEESDFQLNTDKEKFYAILVNLVKNSLKYTKTGFIKIGVSKPYHQYLFYVKDTGIGIPPDRLEAIFERFIQSDISDKMARQGAGLGLSICKAYVEMLGGKIWVESAEGKGSVFYFTLPE